MNPPCSRKINREVGQSVICVDFILLNFLARDFLNIPEHCIKGKVCGKIMKQYLSNKICLIYCSL